MKKLINLFTEFYGNSYKDRDEVFITVTAKEFDAAQVQYLADRNTTISYDSESCKVYARFTLNKSEL